MIIGISGPAGSGKDTVADYLVQKQGFVRISLADSIKRYCKEVFQFSDDQLWGPSEKRVEPDLRYPRTCIECRGMKYTFLRCEDPQCGDSTWDHECGGTTTCPTCKGTGETFLTPREALQLLGTEWGRTCYPDIWVLYTIRIAKDLLTGQSDRGGSLRYDQRTGVSKVYDARSPGIRGVVIPDVRFQNEMTWIRNSEGYLWRVLPPNGFEGTGSGWRGHPSETEQAAIPNDSFDAVILNKKSGFEDLYKEVEATLSRCK